MKSVESAMIKPVTVKADDSLNDAVDIMRTRRRHYFVVNNQNKLLGFLDIEDINQGLRARKELIDTMQRMFTKYISIQNYKTLCVQF